MRGKHPLTDDSLLHSLVAHALLDCDFVKKQIHDGCNRRSQTKAILPKLRTRPMELLSGLMIKVKHNALDTIFPVTFQALKRTGIEIPLFAAYTFKYQRLSANSKLSWYDKATNFLSFLNQYQIANPTKAGLLITDLANHEKTLWDIRNSSARSKIIASAGHRSRANNSLLNQLMIGKLLPHVSDRAKHCYFEHCNPYEVSKNLEMELASLPTRKNNPCHLIYMSNMHDAEIAVIKIDALAALLVDLSNGKRSLKAIMNILDSFTGKDAVRCSAKQIASLYLTLAEKQIISFCDSVAHQDRS